jgi:hypothetical protein
MAMSGVLNTQKRVGVFLVQSHVFKVEYHEGAASLGLEDDREELGVDAAHRRVPGVPGDLDPIVALLEKQK